MRLVDAMLWIVLRGPLVQLMLVLVQVLVTWILVAVWWVRQ